MLSLFPIHVTFPFTPLSDVEAFSLICLRRIGAMDTCRLVLNVRPGDANPYITAGSPMRVTWRGDGVEDEFVGYVHSYQPITTNYLERVLVVGISAAYPMLNESGRSFYQVGIHNVAEEIADDYRFQPEVDPHPLQRDQLLQQDETDWTFLKRLGDEWGYVLVLDGVTLIFRPLKAVLMENARFAENETTVSRLSSTSGGRMISFEPSFSAAGPNPYTISTGQGVQPVSTSRIEWQAAGKGVFGEVATGTSVITELEGEMAALGKEARSRFPFTAKATVLYPSGKKPLDAYRISHQGKTWTWTIHTVKHIVTGGQYLGEMVLGSDGADYADADSDNLDIALLLLRNRRSYRPIPTIVDIRPYYVGTGANAVVDDERWKARLMRVQISG